MRFINFLVISIACLCSATITAQNLGPSPYSRLGIGELADPSSSRNVAMGGAGMGLYHHFQLSSTNPASLAALKYTNLEFGIAGKRTTLSTTSENQMSSSANLTNVSLAFPLHKRFTTQFGAKPFSSVSYTDNITQVVNERTFSATYSGSGGLAEFFWGNAYHYKDWLMLGLKTSVVNGQVTNDFTQVDPGRAQYYTVNMRHETHLGFSPGFLITKEIKRNQLPANLASDSSKADSLIPVTLKETSESNSNWFVGIGVSGSFYKPLTVTEDKYYEQSRYALVAGGYYDYITYSTDTIYSRQNGNYKLPGSFKAGISLYQPNKLSLALDYSQSDWSQFTYAPFSQTTYRMQQTVAFGAEYIPDFNSIRYFKRMPYRAGASFTSLPYTISGQSITQWQVTAGSSFTLAKSGVTINLGFVYGSRGTTAANLYKENYLMMNLAVISNNKWFIRRKHD